MMSRLGRAAAVLCATAAVASAGEAKAAGALETIAPALAKQLAAAGAVPAGALVAASALTSDTPAPKGDELSSRVAALVAGALGGAARAHPQAAPLSVARAAAGKAGALVYLQVELAKGELRVTADAYPVSSNAWDRVRMPQPPPKAHAFASAPVDAEVRTFLPAIPLERAAVHKAKEDEGDVLAVACGDVDGDGGLELLLVSRARVTLARIAGGKVTPVRAVPWSALAVRAPVPLREPLGTAAIAPGTPRVVRVGVSDRGGVALDASLGAKVALRGLPLDIGPSGLGDACAALRPEASAFEGDVVACAGSAKAPPRVSPPIARYDAFVGAEIVAPDGTTRPAFAAREPQGKLRIRLGDAVTMLDGVGAQVAVGDLDQDGQLDVVTSAAEGDDVLTVTSWNGEGEPRTRLTLPAPGGVRAVAVCPPEERAAPAWVAVVGDEVWLVR